MGRTLVIGDVHGHFNRLEALLLQEELIDFDGNRIKPEVEVVQLGDLGHFGRNTRTADKITWQNAPRWLDKILWGNHDRAVIEVMRHGFGGYAPPHGETADFMEACWREKKLDLAHSAHGYLLTHAGLHPGCYEGEGDLHLPVMDVESFANWLNQEDRRGEEASERFKNIRDYVGPSRQGRHPYGGILWRDFDEKIYDGFPQVFGHTKQPVSQSVGKHFCVDVGDQHNGCLAGIYLPDCKVVSVEVDEKPLLSATELEQMVLAVGEKRHNAAS